MSTTKAKTTNALDRVRDLLAQGRPDDALEHLDHVGQTTPEFQNARAVCLMRLGKVPQAVSLLRDLVFRGNICIPSDAPVLYLINFATAMLLANYKDGAMPILKGLDARRYPQVGELKEAVERWVRGLSFLERCGYRLGLYPGKPIHMDFPLGRLELTEANEGPRFSA